MTRSIAVAREGAVAILTLDRPDTSNFLDQAMRAEIADACAEAGSDSAVRAIVLMGSGPAFATGMESPPIAAHPASVVPGAAVVASLTKPTIAWIEGDCLDMGLELALACDLRIAAPGARLGLRHVREGRLPWDGGTQRLARAVGRAHALRLLLTGEVVGAEEALRIGLVQQVGGQEEAMALAERIASGAPLAMRSAKEAASAGLDLTLEQGLRLEADLSILLHSTEDRAEGLRSFAERRAPRFEGR